MSSDDDKPHDPTPKKLSDARKKGEIARSADLNTAAGYAGFTLAAAALGTVSLTRMGTGAMQMLQQADTVAPRLFDGSGTALTGGLMRDVLASVSIWFAIPALAVLLSILAQGSFIIAPEKLSPKLSRLSPITNAKNKFGRAGLFEFAKSALKLSLYAVLLAIYCARSLPDILATMQYSPGMAFAQMMRAGFEFLLVVTVIAACIGAGDYLWQHFEHLRKNRMSLQELKDEVKGAEGDPHIKQQRRQRGMQIATNRMLADVPQADVVIVNPTHYAVALKWDRNAPGAPVCVAKGVDEIAARIRERAAEAAIPLHSNPPTARALHATVEIGQEVPPEHYRAVAAAIRFAEAMRMRAGKRP